ncbi:hypothetical protein Pmar_PMAR012724, partial [Perkinsus marinus ATCC 50983]
GSTNVLGQDRLRYKLHQNLESNGHTIISGTKLSDVTSARRCQGSTPPLTERM